MNHHSQNALLTADGEGQARGGWFLLPLACRAPLIRAYRFGVSEVRHLARAALSGAGLSEATT